MKIKRFGLWLGMLYICGGCYSGDSSVSVINLKELKGEMVLEWEQVVRNSRLVRLETKPEVLLEGYLKIWVGEKYIITYGEKEIHQFASDGKYIRRLAVAGRGPEEFKDIRGLTVDEKRDRLYFSHWGNLEELRVMELKSGKQEKVIPVTHGAVYRLVLAEDSLLYVLPLKRQNVEYDLYTLDVNGRFKGGIAKKSADSQHAMSGYYLSVYGDKVYYMRGFDTLYQVGKDRGVPEACFKTVYSKRRERWDELGMLLETKNFLLYRHEYFYIRTEGEKIIGGFDPNLPPKTCIFFKNKTQTQQVKSWRINLLDKELEELTVGVSEKYVYTKFNAIAFRELVKDPQSPYHDWYTQVADEDNPVLLVGER